MTAIAGFWQLEGQPCAAVCTAPMLSAQSIYGGDGSVFQDYGFIALGRQLSRVLPEDVFDHGPILSSDGNLTLTADIRIDNREELCAGLSIPAGRAATLCDTALLLAGYEKWGDAVTTHIVGEFAFALWDGRLRRLVLARDFAGLRPLHYHAGNGFFAFSSMPKGLLALPEIPRTCDEERMVGFLLLLPESGPQSFFAGISRVEAGHIVTVSGGNVLQRPWWHPPRAKLRLRSPDEYAEGLRHHLDQAVRSRLRGTSGGVGSHLSGGFDSGSVTATAARIKSETGGCLTAFTAVPGRGFTPSPSSRHIEDEGPLAATVAAMYPNIDHILVRSGHISPFEGLERDFLLYDRPLLNTCNHTWLAAINDAVTERGLRVLLTGQMGNASTSYTGSHRLHELLATGRWWKLWSESRALAANRFTTQRSALAAAISPLIPEWLRDRMRRVDANRMPRHTALNPARWTRRRDVASPRDAVSYRVSAMRRVDPGNFNKGMLGGWGIEIRDPTADRRLVEFCLSVPTEQFLADGVPRALARRAFAGMLPAELLNERRPGRQAADWYEGLAAGRHQAIGEIEHLASCPSAAAVLDLPRLRALTENWPSGNWESEEIQENYLLALPRGLAAGHFLRRASESCQAAVSVAR